MSERWHGVVKSMSGMCPVSPIIRYIMNLISLSCWMHFIKLLNVWYYLTWLEELSPFPPCWWRNTVLVSQALTNSVLNISIGPGLGWWKCLGFASWEASSSPTSPPSSLFVFAPLRNSNWCFLTFFSPKALLSCFHQNDTAAHTQSANGKKNNL